MMARLIQALTMYHFLTLILLVTMAVAKEDDNGEVAFNLFSDVAPYVICLWYYESPLVR